MTYNDPIVNEVRKSRQLILNKCNGDIDKLFEYIREEEAKNPERLSKISFLKNKSIINTIFNK
ncbi:MAG: hypothetical protein K6T65_10050 [Peptococcaceae bacterium]|nr:hypothetical protein [Peptococcaceae bacterium]